MEPQKTPNGQSNLEKRKIKLETSQFPLQDILQRYSHQSSMVFGTKIDTQINGIEQRDHEISPQLYGQFIYYKEGKKAEWVKQQSLQQMVLGKLDNIV